MTVWDATAGQMGRFRIVKDEPEKFSGYVLALLGGKLQVTFWSEKYNQENGAFLVTHYGDCGFVPQKQIFGYVAEVFTKERSNVENR